MRHRKSGCRLDSVARSLRFDWIACAPLVLEPSPIEPIEHRHHRSHLVKDGFQGHPGPGYTVPLHRALSEPILLGGAPRAIAIMNGTLAGAVGLGLRLWLVGIAIWAIGHFAAVWAAKRDPLFVEVGRRHLRIPAHLSV